MLRPLPSPRPSRYEQDPIAKNSVVHLDSNGFWLLPKTDELAEGVIGSKAVWTLNRCRLGNPRRMDEFRIFLLVPRPFQGYHIVFHRGPAIPRRVT